MVRRPYARHARPSGAAAMAAAYDDVRAELTAVRSARWTDQLETVRLSALTDELTAQVGALQRELADVRQELLDARSAPPLVVEVPASGWSSVAPPSGWSNMAPAAAWPAYPAAAPAVATPPTGPAQGAPTYAAPAQGTPAYAVPAAAPVREDLLLAEMAELRRLVVHQQTLLADLTVRLLDLLARFVPAAVAPSAPGGAGAEGAQASQGQAPFPASQPSDLVIDDETATRLRVIRESFGR